MKTTNKYQAHTTDYDSHMDFIANDTIAINAAHVEALFMDTVILELAHREALAEDAERNATKCSAILEEIKAEDRANVGAYSSPRIYVDNPRTCESTPAPNYLKLSNHNTVFVLSGKELVIDDLRDNINEPTAYNKTVRGLDKAVAAVKAAWTEETTMYDAIDILWQYKIRTHSYCRMD